MSSEQHPSLIGRVLADKLRLDSLLGEGAAGAVYRAHHLTLDKPVAIKVLHQSHAHDPQLIRRFKAEARAASRMDHPNSVRILDFGEDGADQLLYIAMEFLDGQSLQQLMEQEPQLASWRIASIMAQVAAGLAVAHDLGIVHRDVKPGNVMLLRQLGEEGVEQEVVKVCDFGLAKILDANPDEMTGGPLTKAGTIFGTPTYMSPEQANGHTVDGRADQYACGVMMYKMAAGVPPFSADTSTGVLMKHILEAPTPVLEVAPHLDPRIAAVVDRALSKEPEQRFESLRDIVPILREVAASAPQGAVPVVRMPSVVARTATPSIPGGHAGTGHSDTLPRPALAVAPMASNPAVASAPPPVAPPASKAPMLAAVMGSVALLAVGGLGTYVLMSERGQGPEIAAMPAPTPPDAGQIAAPSTPEPAPAPADAGAPLDAELKPEAQPPVQPSARPAPKPKPKPTPAPKPKPKPTPAPKPKPKPAATPKPAPAATPKPKPAPADAGVAPPAAKPPALAKPPVITSKPSTGLGRPTLKEGLRPQGPKALPKNFQVKVELTDVEVGGGLSTGRTREALERRLEDVRACLHNMARKAGVMQSAKVRLTGRVEVRGQLRKLTVKGGSSAARQCVSKGFDGARMPRPDTGAATLNASLSYETVPR